MSIKLCCLVTGYKGMNNLPRVVMQPCLTRRRTRDLLITSPTMKSLSHYTTLVCVKLWPEEICSVVSHLLLVTVLQLAYCVVQFLEKDATLTEPVIKL